jgi:hypothetical protein
MDLPKALPSALARLKTPAATAALEPLTDLTHVTDHEFEHLQGNGVRQARLDIAGTLRRRLGRRGLYDTKDIPLAGTSANICESMSRLSIGWGVRRPYTDPQQSEHGRVPPIRGLSNLTSWCKKQINAA